MKKKQVKKFIPATLTKRIEKAKQQLERLEKFQEYEHYFSNVKNKTRCSYIIEIRKILFNELIEESLTLAECSSILHISHCSLIAMQKTNSSKYVNREVRANYRQWLQDKVYPYTSKYKKGYLTSLTVEEALDKEWGVEKPYNLCSIYKYHND